MQHHLVRERGLVRSLRADDALPRLDHAHQRQRDLQRDGDLRVEHELLELRQQPVAHALRQSRGEGVEPVGRDGAHVLAGHELDAGIGARVSVGVGVEKLGAAACLRVLRVLLQKIAAARGPSPPPLERLCHRRARLRAVQGLTHAREQLRAGRQVASLRVFVR